MVLRTKNSTQISDDIMAAKDILDRSDVMATDASNSKFNPKQAHAIRKKKTSQPKIPVTRETISLNKVIMQNEMPPI